MEAQVESTAVPEASPPYYTVSAAARRLGVTYQKLIYAIAKQWLTPFQMEPIILISEIELFRYAAEQDIEIP